MPFSLVYFTLAVVVKMPRIVLTSAEPITGTCTTLICPCRSNFAFKMIIHTILCRFTYYFPVAMLVGVPGVVLAAAGPVAGACMGLVYPCWSNFAFKTFIDAILCRFHLFI
jgi:hypothetical protein